MIATLALWFLLGCGDDDDAPDAAVDASDDASMPRAIAPMPPEAPRFAPCPEGWTSETRDDVQTCAPFGDAPARCDDGLFQAPGSRECVRLGSACPADGLPTIEDAIFVRAGAIDGDGTRARPLGSIAAGISAAGVGGTVAIGVGEYDEDLHVAVGMSLIGACAERTIVRSSRPSENLEAVIEIDTRATTLRDLRIGPSARPGIRALSAAAVTLRDVWVERTTGAGIVVGYGASLDADGLVVRDVIEAEQFGEGLLVRRAVANIVRAEISGCALAGVLAEEDGEIALTSTRLEGNGTFVRPEPAWGVSVSASTVRLDRVAVLGNAGGGVEVYDASTLRGTHVVIADHARFGVVGVEGSTIELAKILVERVTHDGIHVENAATNLTLDDVVVRDVEEGGDFGGHCVDVRGGAAIEVNRAVALRCAGAGVSSRDDGSSAIVRDALIAEDETDEGPPGGTGATQVVEGASLTLERASIHPAGDIGLVSAEGATLLATDLAIVDRRPMAHQDDFGIGLLAFEGATATVERARIAGIHGVGVYSYGAAASVDLREVAIEDISGRDCTGPCAEEPGGFGIYVDAPAAVAIERFEIARASLCGVIVEGMLDMHDGVVRSQPIGACIQAPDFDVQRLQDRVEFIDNGVSLDATSLPIPDPRFTLDP